MGAVRVVLITAVAFLGCTELAVLAAAETRNDSHNSRNDDAVSGYYFRKEEGWFWRNTPPLVPEVPAEPPQEANQVAPDPPKPAAIAKTPTPLSPAWMREQLPEYRDRALANPSDENVRAYFYLQRYAVDMAERFALKAQSVVLGDRILDENSRRPLSTYGARVSDDVAKTETLHLARWIAQTAGLWYFYRSDCPYCRAQTAVLERLERRIGLTTLPIALDGRPLPDGVFARFVTDRGHAASLQVAATPTLFMVKPPDEFVLLSEGLVTDNGLIERMILGALEAGWITEADYDRTRGVRPHRLQADGGELTEELLDDPIRLVAFLRATIGEGAGQYRGQTQ